MSTFKASYYSASVNGMPINNIARGLMEEFFCELEATICNCMAAGVPASAFLVTDPELQLHGNIATVVCHIGFNWELIL